MTDDVGLKPSYILGHVTECDEISDDGGPLWEAEVQLIGGYGVASTIYAGTEDAARRMAEQAIAAWNTRATLSAAPQVGEVTEAMIEAGTKAAIIGRSYDHPNAKYVTEIYRAMCHARSGQ